MKMKKRKICVITGTRAEYGLLYPVMRAIEQHPQLDLSVLACGMHLETRFGNTVDEIKKDGFRIEAEVPMQLKGTSGSNMAKSLGLGIIGMTQAFKKIKPDIIAVLGDRGEPLAAAISGIHMNIAVAHIHGGDRTSGSCIDEPIRHAITQFAHIHFPATLNSAKRLLHMGEENWRIHVVGPLGIYAMGEANFLPKNLLCKNLKLNSDKPIILVLQHPVTTRIKEATEQMRETMEAIVEVKEQAVVIYPNSDAGSEDMIKVIKGYKNYPFIKVFKNLSYLAFISLLKAVEVMVGNSSAGIVDAPLFTLPVVNIGTRQEGRERGANVVDVAPQKKLIAKVIRRVLSDRQFRKRLQRATNPYDVERKGAKRIADILSKVELNENLLQKRFTY